MDKETIKNFIKWLDSATDKEIEDKCNDILNADVTTRESKADLRLALRLLDEKVLARLDLKALKS